MRIVSDPKLVDKIKWGNFVNKHPHGNIFQTPEMYEVYKNSENFEPFIFAVISDDGNIEAVLLAVLVKEKKGLIGLLSARSIIFGGPLYTCSLEFVKKLLKEYDDTICRISIYSQVRNFKETSNEKSLFDESGYAYEEHLNILLDLSISKMELWENYSRSRKKGIKKAQKADFIFSVSNDCKLINAFYDLLTISYKRIKLPYPAKDHFIKICSHLNNENFKIFMLKLNGEYVATLIALQFKNKLYGYYMGLIKDASILKLKPSDLFFNHVFDWCIDNGIVTFDWMGAGKPDEEYGVRDFKLQFGGELLNFGRYTKIHKPYMFKIGKSALKIWQKLK